MLDRFSEVSIARRGDKRVRPFGSPSVLDRDRVRPQALAARTRKQCEGAPGDERERAVGRVDRENLDLIARVIQRIEKIVRTINCEREGSSVRSGQAKLGQRA